MLIHNSFQHFISLPWSPPNLNIFGFIVLGVLLYLSVYTQSCERNLIETPLGGFISWPNLIYDRPLNLPLLQVLFSFTLSYIIMQKSWIMPASGLVEMRWIWVTTHVLKGTEGEAGETADACIVPPFQRRILHQASAGRHIHLVREGDLLRMD